MIIMRVAKRNYDDLVKYLREQGITEDPTFTENENFDSVPCSIPSCSGIVSYSPYGFIPAFKPYKKGFVWFCEQHYSAITYVLERRNEYRVLREMEHKTRREDPDVAKRRLAILKWFTKYQETKNYVESICRELQKQRVHMKPEWLRKWERNGFRVEQTNWFDAYQKNRKAKEDIQKYVSKICHPELRNPN